MDDVNLASAKGGTPTLRVTIRQSQEVVTLMLEGRFSGPWIGEAERAWRAVVRKNSGRALVVDLAGVTFVDGEAKRLLKRIIQQVRELRASDVIPMLLSRK